MDIGDGGMPYLDFLNAIIDDGIEEVRQAYAGPGREEKREGAIKGFEDCRGKGPGEILRLKERSDEAVQAKMQAHAPDYWYWRMRALQVDWVLNVLSAAEHALGRDPHVPPTARGLAKAVDILGCRPTGPAP